MGDFAMRAIKLLCCVAVLGIGAVAHTKVVTRNPLDYAVGADVSTAFTSLVLTRLANRAGTVGYAPILAGAVVGRCTAYGVCPIVNPFGTIGGGTYLLQQYRNCYNANRRGVASLDCREPYSALQVVFLVPTDFVEFQLTWLGDPPALLAYDAAGNEILTCLPSGATGTPAGGLTSFRELSTGAYLGTIRIRASAGRVTKVVVGSYIGSAQVTSLQYSLNPVPCLP